MLYSEKFWKGRKRMKIQQSGEKYLETILILEKRNGIARPVDVARELGFSKASVSRAVAILKEEKLIEKGSINQLLLTKLGRKTAEKSLEKQRILKNFLIMNGIDIKTADTDTQKLSYFFKLKNHKQHEIGIKNSGNAVKII